MLMSSTASSVRSLSPVYEDVSHEEEHVEEQLQVPEPPVVKSKPRKLTKEDRREKRKQALAADLESLENSLKGVKDQEKELKLKKKKVNKLLKKCVPKENRPVSSHTGTINSDVVVSDALVQFLGCPRQFKRPKIMSYIKQYVDQHNLKGTSGNIMLSGIKEFYDLLTPEEQSLYDQNPEEYKVTWRNIQKKLSHHISKAPVQKESTCPPQCDAPCSQDPEQECPPDCPPCSEAEQVPEEQPVQEPLPEEKPKRKRKRAEKVIPDAGLEAPVKRKRTKVSTKKEKA